MPAVTGCASSAKHVFGVIADVHHADRYSNVDKDYSRGIEKLGYSVAYFNSEKLLDKDSYYSRQRKIEFAVQLGDIIDGGHTAERDLQAVVAMFEMVKAPTYHVIGNHEFTDLDRAEVMAALGLERAYYDFRRGKWRFVVLDTMDVSVSGGWGEDSPNVVEARKLLKKLERKGAANAVEWNGGIGGEQKKWLNEVLSKAKSKKEKVIVFGHHPVVPEGDQFNMLNSEEVIGIFESYDCVVAYMNGHRHKDDYIWKNGIYYITIPGMIETQEDKAYAIVWIYDDRLEIQSTGKVPWLSLPFSNR